MDKISFKQHLTFSELKYIKFRFSFEPQNKKFIYKLTCGSLRSGPFSLATDFWKNTWIKLFSEEVVRSKLLSWSALSSHLFLENVKATTGSFSFLRSISIKDSQILRSLEQTEKDMLICRKCFEGENYVIYTTKGQSLTDTVA